MHGRVVRVLLMFLLIATAPVFAQKTSTVASAAKANVPAPTELYAAQTARDRITLSWFAPYLPAKSQGEYVVVCVDDRPARRSAVTAPVQPANATDRGRLLTHVVMVGKEVPHRCHIEMGDPKSGVQRFPFNAVTPTTASVPQPGVVSAIDARQTATRAVTVSWTQSANASAYRIERTGAGGVKTLCYICPPTGTHVDSAVTTGAKYTYAIVAVGPGGASGRALSNEVTVGSNPPLTSVPASAPNVSNVGGAAAPAAGHFTRSTVHQGSNSATQVIRVAAGAQIPQHHHPGHAATLVVHAGDIELTIGSHVRMLRAGDIITVPANTTISGRNTGGVEAQVVAVLSGTVGAGALVVPGPGPN